MKKIIIIVFLIILLPVAPLGYSQSVEDIIKGLDSLSERTQFVVGPLERYSWYVYLQDGDRVTFTIYVNGGSGDDINFSIVKPNNSKMFDGGIKYRWDSSITAESTGNHYFIFDNGFSLVSSKNVIFEYVITPSVLAKATGGGCLIATAAYGSEMAPQVQFLRELRDNTVLQTTSGTAFMTGFNQFYYSFSPYVADYERENPVFKEAVKVTLTPMLTSLTLLNYVEVDTEEEMLGYGIGIILLNVGMYFVAPAAAIIAIKNRINRN